MIAEDMWTLPGARDVLPFDAPRDVWLAERRKGIGGSDTPALLGLSPYSTRFELWQEKTGQVEGFEGNEATARGNWLEPAIADYFAETTGIEVRRVGLLASLGRDHLRTTPDRLTADGGILEIKATMQFAKLARHWRGDVAPHAWVQGQQQLAVSGRKHVWFAADTGVGLPVIHGPFDRDEELISEIVHEVDEFWFWNVLGRDVPDVDLTNISADEIARRWPLGRPGTKREARYPSHVLMMLMERAELTATKSTVATRLQEIDTALKVSVADAETLTVLERPVLTYRNDKNGSRRLRVTWKDKAA